jgi:hypothetical protein
MFARNGSPICQLRDVEIPLWGEDRLVSPSAAGPLISSETPETGPSSLSDAPTRTKFPAYSHSGHVSHRGEDPYILYQTQNAYRTNRILELIACWFHTYHGLGSRFSPSGGSCQDNVNTMDMSLGWLHLLKVTGCCCSFNPSRVKLSAGSHLLVYHYYYHYCLQTHLRGRQTISS